MNSRKSTLILLRVRTTENRIYTYAIYTEWKLQEPTTKTKKTLWWAHFRCQTTCHKPQSETDRTEMISESHANDEWSLFSCKVAGGVHVSEGSSLYRARFPAPWMCSTLFSCVRHSKNIGAFGPMPVMLLSSSIRNPVESVCPSGETNTCLRTTDLSLMDQSLSLTSI